MEWIFELNLGKLFAELVMEDVLVIDLVVEDEEQF